MTALTDRRATVRHLDSAGLSQRAIAARLGVSKDTVRRDLAHTTAPPNPPEDEPPMPNAAPHDEPPPPPAAHTCPTDAPPAPSGSAGASEPAPPGAPTSEPPAATACATCAIPAPPGPGAWLLIPVDDDMRDHLAVLLEAGHHPTDALSLALEKLADAYRSAWDYDHCPRGVRPRISYITRPRHARTNVLDKIPT